MIAQLHRTLIDALRRSRPDALDRPVTVAEIYQDLLPYRTARTVLGFEMNADYEHALLRLLAGEGDFARIEPREVRDKLRLELESPNPDVGLYRNYAACDVWVSLPELESEASGEDWSAAGTSWEEQFLGSDAAEESAPGAAAAVQQDEVADDSDAEPEPQPAKERAATPFEMAGEASRTEPRAAPEAEPDSIACAFCGGDLPAGRNVNFCPFCGSDQSRQPCPSCGESVEPFWRFCVACGAHVRLLGDDVN